MADTAVPSTPSVSHERVRLPRPSAVQNQPDRSSPWRQTIELSDTQDQPLCVARSRKNFSCNMLNSLSARFSNVSPNPATAP